MKKVVSSMMIIFVVYVVCLNLEWDGFLGYTVVIMAMTGLIMKELTNKRK